MLQCINNCTHLMSYTAIQNGDIRYMIQVKIVLFNVYYKILDDCNLIMMNSCGHLSRQVITRYLDVITLSHDGHFNMTCMIKYIRVYSVSILTKGEAQTKTHEYTIIRMNLLTLCYVCVVDNHLELLYGFFI